MPRVAKLNGDFPAAQPKEGEAAADLRLRLAEELGVTPERVGLLAGKVAVASSAPLAKYGDEVLQVVVCPPEETVSGWAVRMLLNELCSGSPEGVDRGLVDERLAAIEIRQAVELRSAIEIITTRALEQPQHGKVAADVVVALDARWPELPLEPGAAEGSAPKTFKGELFAALHGHFTVLREAEPPKAEGAEEGAEGAGEEELQRRRASHEERALALMGFLGRLFVREVVDLQGLLWIVHMLIGDDQKPPGDHQVKCVVELSGIIGPKLEAMKGGRTVMSGILDRIVDLANWAEEHGVNAFSQPVLQQVEDLITLRRRNWGKPLSGFA